MDARTRELEQTLAALVEPILAAQGLILWGLELELSGHGQVVRIYVESEKGPTLDQCAKASRDISYMLDVEDPVPGTYRLEVSTPGMERPFFDPEQMRGHVGERIEARLAEPREGRRNFRGELAEVDPQGRVAITTDTGTFTFDFSEFRKVKLLVDDPWKAAKARGKDTNLSSRRKDS